MSPEIDFNRSKGRWDKVLDKKQANMENKRESLKQMLAKKWKREKAVVERDKDSKAFQEYKH